MRWVTGVAVDTHCTSRGVYLPCVVFFVWGAIAAMSPFNAIPHVA